MSICPPPRSSTIVGPCRLCCLSAFFCRPPSPPSSASAACRLRRRSRAAFLFHGSTSPSSSANRRCNEAITSAFGTLASTLPESYLIPAPTSPEPN
ncbi:hypothetical protein OROHE_019477 [Orobanche hederae]